MALGTGAIDWLSISREFGGSVAGAGTNLNMTAYYGATANIAASGAINAASFKGQTGLAADMGSAKTLTSTGTAGTYLYAEVQIYANGDYKLSDSVGGTTTTRYTGTWKTGYGSGGAYDAKMDKTSGTFWSAGTNTTDGFRNKLNATAAYYMLFNTAGNRDGVFSFKIVANNDGRVLSTVTITNNYNIT